VTNSEPKSAVEAKASSTTDGLTSLIQAAAASARSPRELLEQVAPIVRTHFGAWLAISTMPHREQLTVIDADDTASIIDPELLRIQMIRSGNSPTATTIRLADGRGVRALQVAAGEGASAVGIGMVHLPEQTPDAMTQVQQLKLLSAACEILYNAIQHQQTLPPSPQSLALARDVKPEGSRIRLREFHRSLSVSDTAYAITAESTWMVDCDRVCLMVRQGSDFRLMAVTGVDVIDRRGNESNCLERFVKSAVALGAPMAYPTEEEMPPQIEVPMSEYLDQSLVQSGILVPIFEPIAAPMQDEPVKGKREPIAVIAFERFRGQPIAALTPAMQAVCDEAAIAIRNATAHESIFLLPVWQTIGQQIAPARRNKSIAIVGMLMSLLLASLFIQIDYKVTATGTLEPAVVQNLFATTDGVVTRLHVQDGEFVEKGDLLVELENAELQRQTEEIAGEIYTATEKLTAINASMISARTARNESNQGDSNAIERRQLETQLKSLKAQQAVVLAEKERLAIRSPIAGQVVGWRLSQRLEQRPVSRGHRLFSVVDVNGPKVLKLQVPDRDSADVLRQAKSANDDLAVDFILATEPDHSRSATISEIASATRVDAQGLNVLDVMADVTDQSLTTTKMGTDVTAAIHCGRRSIMATWFGDVARFYHRHVRFYLG
jgi:multidrug efflux pump subunit AcrA (membrane-fusion protein)